ncbi:GDSL-like lipase/acylhydrolase family protein [Labedaea rhizosphaerae]|uniref:GDSL-like lipase/acylhydrolase family protein n=2 Tax=Labedaea rhizosphaerae TaxID=598644 RepID=A0A4R6SK06_LABRH|nr:GDSL-like lipase/acylhydrolase family protein [Labedaea rhizosphaerae]
MATGLVCLGSAQAAAAGPKDYKIDIVGDSYSAGEGMRGTYFDAHDPRHRSPDAAGAQAMQKVEDANPSVTIHGAMGASSGAVTKDFFTPQQPESAGSPQVNNPQRDLVRPDADAVIVGFGGNDAHFAEVLFDAITSGSGKAFTKVLQDLQPMLDSQLSADEYRSQAANSAPGQAPTVIARLLQVYQAVHERAPHAKLVVPNYPLAIDPKVKTPYYSGFSKDELQRIQAFGKQLNAAIAKAVEVCGCAELADVSQSMTGREVYTDNPGLTDTGVAFTGGVGKWASHEPFHPNARGGALMSNAIAKALAKALGLKSPAPTGDRLTPFSKLQQLVPDVNGDGIDDRAAQGPRKHKKAMPKHPRPAVVDEHHSDGTNSTPASGLALGKDKSKGLIPRSGLIPNNGVTPGKGSTPGKESTPSKRSTPSKGSTPGNGSTPGKGSTPAKGSSGTGAGSAPATGSTPPADSGSGSTSDRGASAGPAPDAGTAPPSRADASGADSGSGNVPGTKADAVPAVGASTDTAAGNSRLAATGGGAQAPAPAPQPGPVMDPMLGLAPGMLASGTNMFAPMNPPAPQGPAPGAWSAPGGPGDTSSLNIGAGNTGSSGLGGGLSTVNPGAYGGGFGSGNTGGSGLGSTGGSGLGSSPGGSGIGVSPGGTESSGVGCTCS